MFNFIFQILNTFWKSLYIIKQFKYIHISHYCCKCLDASADLRKFPFHSYFRLVNSQHTFLSPPHTNSDFLPPNILKCPHIQRKCLYFSSSKNESNSLAKDSCNPFFKNITSLVILPPHHYQSVLSIGIFHCINIYVLVSPIFLVIEPHEIDIFLKNQVNMANFM